VKQTTSGRSPDSDSETFDEDITGDHVARYEFGPSARTDYAPHEPAPLFHSGHDDDPEPREVTHPLLKPRLRVSSRILASVLAASGVAILFALFSSDDMQNIVVDAELSISALLPGSSGAGQLTARDIELLKNPAALSRPSNLTPDIRSETTVAPAPSREEVTSAYQSATQSEVPAAVAPAAVATNAQSAAEQEALFKQFLAWEAERNARAQAPARPKKAKSLPPM
jgi:hypothetical protein